MSSPLVSIISPCFNGEKYIDRFLESVLSQDYESIELIVVDDGSTDKTLYKLYSYKERFEEKGYIYKVLVQDNQGQSSAINKALPFVEGQFLTWPDSDDVLTKSSISKKVSYLRKNNDVNIVRSDVEFIDEDHSHLYYASDRYHFRTKNIFEDLIFENDVYFCPGGYMIRMSCFDCVFSNRNIIESRAGQNWQMLLPICLSNICGYIDEVTYRYVVRRGSHSRSSSTYLEKKSKFEKHQSLLIDVVNMLGISGCIEPIKHKYQMKFIYLACEYNKFDEAIVIVKNNISLISIFTFLKAVLNRYRNKS